MGKRDGVAWVLATARAGDLRPQDVGDTISYVLEGTVTLQTGADSVESHSTRTRVERDSKLRDDDGLDLMLPIRLRSGRYPYTFVLREDGPSAGRGNWHRDTLLMPDVSPELPTLSDIAVAADSGGTWTRDGAVFLSPSPSHVTTPAGDLNIYFEAYGLQPGTGYEVEIRMVRDSERDRLYDLQAGDLAFRLSFRTEFPSGGIGHHHLRLSLGDSEPGRYSLGVRITDVESGVSSLPAITWVQRTE